MANNKPYNLTYPLNRGKIGWFQCNDTTISGVRENIKHVLLTLKGSRVMQRSYGSNIPRYLYENITEKVKGQIKGEIEQAINTWVTDIQLLSVNVYSQDDLAPTFINTHNIDDHSIFAIIEYTVIAGAGVFEPQKLSLVIKN